MAQEFLYGFSIGLGFDKAVLDPVNQHLYELKVGTEELGDFTKVADALAALRKFLSSRSDMDEAFMEQVCDIRYWDRYYVDMFDLEADE